jgi:hypothetical protein
MEKIQSGETHTLKNETKLMILKINEKEVTIPKNGKVIFSPKNGKDVYLYNCKKNTLAKIVEDDGFHPTYFLGRAA